LYEAHVEWDRRAWPAPLAKFIRPHEPIQAKQSPLAHRLRLAPIFAIM